MRMTADMASYLPPCWCSARSPACSTASHPGVARGVAGVAGGLGGDDVRRCCGCRSGCRTCHRSSTWRSCPENFDWMPFVALSLLALAPECRGPARYPAARHPLACVPCGSPSPAGTCSRAGPAGPRSACGAPCWATRRWSSSGRRALSGATRPSCRSRGTSPTGGAPPTSSRPASSWTPRPAGCALGAVEEDDEGVTITEEWVEDAATSGLFVAHALGTLRRGHLEAGAWLARNHLRDRMARVERHGGWRTLARTTVADVADVLWNRRGELLAAADALVQVPVHGDAVPANLPGRDGDDVLAVDWAMVGTGPVGPTSASTPWRREELDPLIDAYLMGLPDGLATGPRSPSVPGSPRSTPCSTGPRVGPGLGRRRRGRPAGKFRHPPSLRTPACPPAPVHPTSRRWSRGRALGRWGRPPSSHRHGLVTNRQVFLPNPLRLVTNPPQSGARRRTPRRLWDSKRADPGTSSGMYADWSTAARFGQNPCGCDQSAWFSGAVRPGRAGRATQTAPAAGVTRPSGEA